MHEQNIAGVHVRLHQPMLTDVDEFRQSERDCPTRPEAIRRLVQLALTRTDGSTGNGEAAP